MNKNIKTIGDKSFPAIGYGPGVMGLTFRYKAPKGRILRSVQRRINKYILTPIQKRKFVKDIAFALKSGYRLLDYSASYGNMDAIGKAILKSGIPREELFITTRVSNQAQMGGYVRSEFLDSLKEMGLTYVDLLQFHWPVTGYYLDTWREMEKLYEEGYVKHLGVANCHQHHIEEILRICKYKPEIGQFECHPLFSQKTLISYYQEKGILIEAYTPTARYDDRLVKLPVLKELEKKYHKSFIQIIFRWHIQNGLIPLTRTWNHDHMLHNFDIFDFELEEADMYKIDAININSRLRFDPDNCDFSIL